MDRDAFLGVVEAAVGSGRLPSRPDSDPGLIVPELADGELRTVFQAALERVDATFHDPDDPVGTVAAIAGDAGAESFLAWDELPVPGIVAALEAAGLRRVDATVSSDRRIEHQQGYFPVILGVTGAEAAFAESGSIVVRSGPGRPRMASLIPDVHIALLQRDTIHRSLAHWAARHARSMADDANVVFITGVSRTGDIEMQLNTGVHGPRALHVILL